MQGSSVVCRQPVWIYAGYWSVAGCQMCRLLQRTFERVKSAATASPLSGPSHALTADRRWPATPSSAETPPRITGRGSALSTRVRPAMSWQTCAREPSTSCRCLPRMTSEWATRARCRLPSECPLHQLQVRSYIENPNLADLKNSQNSRIFTNYKMSQNAKNNSA